MDVSVLVAQLLCPSPRWQSSSPVEASLVVQWLRICLAMQGTRSENKDCICLGAAKSVCSNY